jgi:antitoxin CptB
MSDDRLALRRKRLLFRSVRRGTKESDLIIGGFAQAWLPRLDEGQLDRFESLLEQNDPELLSWILGLKPPPPAHDHDVVRLIRSFKDSIPRN